MINTIGRLLEVVIIMIRIMTSIHIITYLHLPQNFLTPPEKQHTSYTMLSVHYYTPLTSLLHRLQSGLIKNE